MPPTKSSSDKKASMKTLQTRLKGLLLSFHNIANFADNYPAATTASQISVRLEKLEDLWESINDTYFETETHEEFSADNDSFLKERTDFENRFYDVKAFLLERAKASQDQLIKPHDMQPTVDHVRLPQIKLQSFDGNIDEWLSFRDLFTSLIHLKDDLPNVEKLHYLKGCLEGEAKALIDSLRITEANYKIAWEMLSNRYNNSKLLKKRQVQALYKLPVLNKESVKDLHLLLDGFEKAIQTLDQVVEPADYKDLLLVDLLSSRLDPSTRRGWEEYSSTRERDTLKELTEFLERRLRVLEALPVKAAEIKHDASILSKRKVFTTQSHTIAPSNISKCIACTEKHWLFMCPTFKRMSVANRDSLLRNQSLCRNCFKKGHYAKECTSKNSCRNCNGRHHTMVCFQTERVHNNPSGDKQQESTEASTSRVSNMAARKASPNVSGNNSSKVLLATAIIYIEDNGGLRYPVRALLDSGSECNLISEKLCQRMIVARQHVNISIKGIGPAATRVKHQIHAYIKSRTTSFT